MLSSSIIHPSRWLSSFYRSFSNSNRLIIKNFDRKTFDYLASRRLEKFNGNKEQMSRDIHANLQSLFKTSSVLNYLTNSNSRNSTKSFSQTISIEQLTDILFFAYENNLKLDLFTKHLLECLSPINKPIPFNLHLELINLLVLHQQKHYDHQTKNPNKILQNLIHHLELSLTKDQIHNLPLPEFSLFCSAMYRLQIPLQNQDLLESIGQYLINDEQKKSLSAVDKQNLIKILSLSNYGRREIAQALANRFNQSFEQHLQSNLTSFSYEIVRMTMRIGIYFSLLRFYSARFFRNCCKLIELESSSHKPSYRAKDIIQIMNTLISMGYIRQINSKYIDLIDMYDRMNQFDQKPERLVDVLAPLTSIDYFPDQLLKKLFTQENLLQLNGRISHNVSEEIDLTIFRISSERKVVLHRTILSSTSFSITNTSRPGLNGIRTNQRKRFHRFISVELSRFITASYFWFMDDRETKTTEFFSHYGTIVRMCTGSVLCQKCFSLETFQKSRSVTNPMNSMKMKCFRYYHSSQW